MKTLLSKSLISLITILTFSSLISAKTDSTEVDEYMVEGETVEEEITNEDLIPEDPLAPRTYLSIGYLQIVQTFPAGYIGQNKPQNGILLGLNYNLATIAKSGYARMNIGASFNLGAAFSKSSLYTSFPEANHNTNHSYKFNTYTAIADLFSLNANFEYLFKFSKDNSLEAALAVTFLNIGGTVNYFEAPGTAIDKGYTYMANFLPLLIQPSAKMRLGTFAIGLGFYINPINFLEYRGNSKNYSGTQKAGFKRSSGELKKYAANLFLNF